MKLRHGAPLALVLLVSGILIAELLGPSTNAGSEHTRETTQRSPSASRSKQSLAFSPYVDHAGRISLPKDYKQKWAHLGNWAVAKERGKTVHEMHSVYTQPETVASYNKTGKFPDGAVLVKEVREAKAGQLTTGHSAWSTGIKIWFVMIKDRKGRFDESEHWGDGWGWALFEAKDQSKNISVGYDTSCLGCHVPAEDTDWVYTYGYPELKKPK